jgi:hypothetical protein
MDASTNRVREWKHIVRDPLAWILLSPAIWSALFWILVLTAAIVDGGWPRARSGYPGMASYDHASMDPAQLGPFYIVVGLSLFALPLLVALGTGASALSIFVRRLRRPRPQIAFLLGTLIAYATVGWNLGGYFEWFVD